ncbi:MAG: hypothetical protein HC822_09500 [Oscillochloris sp.]|nr:hypothetical protein [Oscillochloris sp.]
MTRLHHQSILSMIAIMLVTILGPAVPATIAAPIEPQAELQATPTTLVDEPIDGFALVEPRLFWWNTPICIAGFGGGPGLAEAPPVDELTEAISRKATYGGEIRRLYYRSGTEVGSGCGQQDIEFAPLSNLIADEDYLYWLDQSGLVRLSTDANPGDQPELLVDLATNSGAELVQTKPRSTRCYVAAARIKAPRSAGSPRITAAM